MGTKARTRMTIAAPMSADVQTQDDGELKATFKVDSSRRSTNNHAAQLAFRIRLGPDPVPDGFLGMKVVVNDKDVWGPVLHGDYLSKRFRTLHVPFVGNQAVLRGAAAGPNVVEFHLLFTGAAADRAVGIEDQRWVEIEALTLTFHAKR